MQAIDHLHHDIQSLGQFIKPLFGKIQGLQATDIKKNFLSILNKMKACNT